MIQWIKCKVYGCFFHNREGTAAIGNWILSCFSVCLMITTLLSHASFLNPNHDFVTSAVFTISKSDKCSLVTVRKSHSYDRRQDRMFHRRKYKKKPTLLSDYTPDWARIKGLPVYIHWFLWCLSCRKQNPFNTDNVIFAMYSFSLRKMQ